MSMHFLEHYGVHKKPHAIAAARKAARLDGGETDVRDRSKVIRAYLARLERILLHPDPLKRARNIAMLKPFLYESTVIKAEDFPETHFSYHQRLLKERGMGDQAFDDEMRMREIARVIDSQKKSLDAWIGYLSGDECKYPADVKYFAIQGVLKLGKLDTKTYTFARREIGTVAPFPEIDREALSKVLGALDAKYASAERRKSDDELVAEGYSPSLLELINRRKGFGDMYGQAMKELDLVLDKDRLLPITAGKWIRFEQGSDPSVLVRALEGKRSNLCIADIGAAGSYLSEGSIDIYFSYDRAGRLFLPRVAVAMAEDKGGVYEVRGTWNKNEDVDPYFSEAGILGPYLRGLPGGDSYLKKDADMRRLTAIYNAHFHVDRETGNLIPVNAPLNQGDAAFLYEVDSKIQGFGYFRDPRIDEILVERDPGEDAGVALGVAPEELARRVEDVTERTKAYIGPLFPGIFSHYRNIKRVYTSFPEEEIKPYTLHIGGMTPEELDSLVTRGLHEGRYGLQHFRISDEARGMILGESFGAVRESERIKLVTISVRDLFCDRFSHSLDDIYKRAFELGLIFCPPEVGPRLRAKMTHQLRFEEDCWVFMSPIRPLALKDDYYRAHSTRPSIFHLKRSASDDLWLLDEPYRPDLTLCPEYKMVFRLPE